MQEKNHLINYFTASKSFWCENQQSTNKKEFRSLGSEEENTSSTRRYFWCLRYNVVYRI